MSNPIGAIKLTVLSFLLGFSVPLFAEHEIQILETGEAVSQTALVLEEQIIVFSVLASGDRFFQTVNAQQQLDTTSSPVPAEIVFVDALQLGSKLVPVLIGPKVATRLDTGEVVLQFNSLYNAPVINVLPRYNAFRDLNGDGLDDFLMPTFDGYEVAIQTPSGSFTKPQTLFARPLMDMSYNSHPWYQAKNIFLGDMTGDQRNDIVFYEDNHFVVYPQGENRRFLTTPVKVKSEVAVDYDGVDGMSVRLQNEDQSDKSVRVVHGIADYNGDGIVDLLVMTIDSAGVFRKSTTFSLHTGSLSGSLVTFGAPVTSAIRSKGIQFETLAEDLDGDGDLDLAVSSIELGVTKIIAALLTSSIKIELSFYLMENGEYPAKPNTTRDLEATFSLSSGEYWRPAMLLANLNGDERRDLLLQTDEDELDAYPGTDEKSVFLSSSTQFSVLLPKDPDLIQVLDWNRDGLSDLVMEVPPEIDEDNDQHRLVLFTSKAPLNQLP